MLYFSTFCIIISLYGGADMSEDYYKKVFSDNLKRYMDLYNKSQVDLINDLGLNKSAVSTWCNGTRLPRMDKVNLLANYFHCNRSDLIEEKIEPKEKAPELTARDERDIKKDLDSLREKLENKELGPAAYDGEDIPDEDVDLFLGQVELMLRRLKVKNKAKYNPNKNKK